MKTFKYTSEEISTLALNAIKRKEDYILELAKRSKNMGVTDNMEEYMTAVKKAIENRDASELESAVREVFNSNIVSILTIAADLNKNGYETAKDAVDKDEAVSKPLYEKGFKALEECERNYDLLNLAKDLIDKYHELKGGPDGKEMSLEDFYKDISEHMDSEEAKEFVESPEALDIKIIIERMKINDVVESLHRLAAERSMRRGVKEIIALTDEKEGEWSFEDFWLSWKNFIKECGVPEDEGMILEVLEKVSTELENV